jgi:hypothetical protein
MPTPPRRPERAKSEPEPEDYLPGATATEPNTPYFRGWPQELYDTAGIRYWRLRDGSGPAPAFNNMAGYNVMYGKVLKWDEGAGKPIVQGDTQYLPESSAKTPDTVKVMQGSTPWYEPTGQNQEPMFEATFIRDLSHEQKEESPVTDDLPASAEETGWPEWIHGKHTDGEDYWYQLKNDANPPTEVLATYYRLYEPRPPTTPPEKNNRDGINLWIPDDNQEQGTCTFEATPYP